MAHAPNPQLVKDISRGISPTGLCDPTSSYPGFVEATVCMHQRPLFSGSHQELYIKLLSPLISVYELATSLY